MSVLEKKKKKKKIKRESDQFSCLGARGQEGLTSWVVFGYDGPEERLWVSADLTQWRVVKPIHSISGSPALQQHLKGNYRHC